MLHRQTCRQNTRTRKIKLKPQQNEERWSSTQDSRVGHLSCLTREAFSCSRCQLTQLAHAQRVRDSGMPGLKETPLGPLPASLQNLCERRRRGCQKWEVASRERCLSCSVFCFGRGSAVARWNSYQLRQHAQGLC